MYCSQLGAATCGGGALGGMDATTGGSGVTGLASRSGGAACDAGRSQGGISTTGGVDAAAGASSFDAGDATAWIGAVWPLSCSCAGESGGVDCRAGLMRGILTVGFTSSSSI